MLTPRVGQIESTVCSRLAESMQVSFFVFFFIVVSLEFCRCSFVWHRLIGLCSWRTRTTAQDAAQGIDQVEPELETARVPKKARAGSYRSPRAGLSLRAWAFQSQSSAELPIETAGKGERFRSKHVFQTTSITMAKVAEAVS